MTTQTHKIRPICEEGPTPGSRLIFVRGQQSGEGDAPHVELLVECSSTHTTLWLELREAAELAEALLAGIAEAKTASSGRAQ